MRSVLDLDPVRSAAAGGHDASKPAPRVPSSRDVGIAPARSRLVRSQVNRFVVVVRDYRRRPIGPMHNELHANRKRIQIDLE